MVRLPRNVKQTHRLNFRPQSDHQIWPWPWPWPWIFKVKYEICYISTKSGPVASKWKANISIWTLEASNVTKGLTLAMTVIFEFSRSYVILTIWWPRPGVRIYQIVTGVTSDVGVPSTHLVLMGGWPGLAARFAIVKAANMVSFNVRSFSDMSSFFPIVLMCLKTAHIPCFIVFWQWGPHIECPFHELPN